jgi:hypothetical protein
MTDLLGTIEIDEEGWREGLQIGLGPIASADEKVHGEQPLLSTNIQKGEGLPKIIDLIVERGGLPA